METRETIGADPAYGLTSEPWRQAHFSAFIQDVLGAFTNRPADLLSFEEVRQRLQLCNLRYLGLQQIPLTNIVGSVGRYRDFNRAFSPRRGFLEERWRRVNMLMTTSTQMPPIELYKIGEAYFVRDGNHRVSVARQLGLATIEAYVWEYPTRVAVGPETDVEELLCKAAQSAFLAQTDADRLCPGFSAELTEPDGYDELLYEIRTFQHALSTIDEREVDMPEAVMLWHEMQYTPIVEIIRQSDILREFPGRTEADLYLWLRRNQEELEIRYGHQVLMEEAAADLARRFGVRPSPARQAARVVGRLAEGLGELSERMHAAAPPADSEVCDEGVACALLAPVRRAARPTPPGRFRGATQAEWQAWRADLRRRLWELLGVAEEPPEATEFGALRFPFPPPRAEVAERTRIPPTAGNSGVYRELIWLESEATEDGLRTPLYLFTPEDAASPRPAVVIFPGHGTIAQAAGVEKPQEAARAALAGKMPPFPPDIASACALELARAGLVTLAVEARGFGLLGAVDHLRLDAAARLVGRTWYGMLVQDALRAMDYLLTRAEVDAARVGVAGLGAGGMLALYTAAFDERAQAAWIGGCLGKYATLALDEGGCPCHNIPGILRYAEMGDVAALIAPRPVLFVNGQCDPASSPAARESFAVAQQIYRFLGVTRHARLLEPEEMGHEFDCQLALGWFRRWWSE